jgi:hypothetical protein
MPSYQNNPSGNNPVQMLLRGVPGYAFGSWDADQSTTLMQVTSVAKTGGTATVGVTMREGDIPIVGNLITVRGVATDNSFNVTNASLTNVTIDATTGKGTVQYAVTGGVVVTTPDAGQAYVPVQEVGEAVANGSSQAFAVQEVPAGDDNQMTVTWSTFFPSNPAAVTVNLQGSLFDIDAQYATLDSSTSVSGETRTISDIRFRFLRFNITGASGGSSPTIVGKLLV